MRGKKKKKQKKKELLSKPGPGMALAWHRMAGMTGMAGMAG